MEELQEHVDRLVTAGIRAYIGLLCCGEQVRSRRVLDDTMQISSIVAGGPSARFGLGGRPITAREAAATAANSLTRCLIYFSMRSLLASLLVLRATVYWERVPALRELQESCASVNDRLARTLPGSGESVIAEPRRRFRVRGRSDDDAAGCSAMVTPTGGRSGPHSGAAAAFRPGVVEPAAARAR